jgi:pyruvate dehydrogenase (quinone)/pyruvate oxidase
VEILGGFTLLVPRHHLFFNYDWDSPGDGGFEMLMAEFATAVQYKLPIKVVVMRNDVLGMIKWEQMVFLGNPEYGVELTPIDLVKFAEACGGAGFRCERAADVRRTLEAALLSTGPALVEAVVDPFEPPMPPSLSVEDAMRLAKALGRGESQGSRIALTLFRNKVRELP